MNEITKTEKKWRQSANISKHNRNLRTRHSYNEMEGEDYKIKIFKATIGGKVYTS